MTSPADPTNQSPAPAAPSNETPSAPRAQSNVTPNQNHKPEEPIRDPVAYHSAQLEKMERLLAKQEARYIASVKEQAVAGLLARVPDDDDLRALALDYASRTVTVDPESLAVDLGQASAFVDKLAAKFSAPAAPAADAEQPAPPRAKTTIVHPPPSAETAPSKSIDWRVRLHQTLEEI